MIFHALGHACYARVFYIHRSIKLISATVSKQERDIRYARTIFFISAGLSISQSSFISCQVSFFFFACHHRRLLKSTWILDILFHAKCTVCMLSWSNLKVLQESRCVLSERFNHWPTLLKINDQTSLTNRRHLFALKIIATISADWQTWEIELWSTINTHDRHFLMKSRNNKLLVE